MKPWEFGVALGLTLFLLGTANALPILPVPGPIEYGPCRYPSDSLQALGSNGRPKVLHPSEIREFCPDAVVNGVPEECRKYWMVQARRLPFDSAVRTKNLHCPGSMFSAVLVDHTDGSSNNQVLDGYNCGSMAIDSNSVPAPSSAAETVESELLRFMWNRFNETKMDRRFWNKFTMYLTAEPSAAATIQMIALGIREIVYSVPIGELAYHGYPVVKIRAAAALQYQPTQYENSRANVLTTTLIGQVLRSDISQLFTWRYNASEPCPGGCQAFKENSVRGLRCRVSS